MLAHMLIAYAQMCLINIHVGASSGTRGLNFVLNVHLHPNFVHTASSEGSRSNSIAPSLLKRLSGRELVSKLSKPHYSLLIVLVKPSKTRPDMT